MIRDEIKGDLAEYHGPLEVAIFCKPVGSHGANAWLALQGEAT